jgi:hypothetical protein
LIAVISGGSRRCEGESPKQSPATQEIAPLQPALLSIMDSYHEM